MQRRGFLARGVAGGVGLAGAAVGLTSCQGAAGGPGGGGSVRLTWWDHVSGNDDLVDTMFRQYSDDTGVAVDYTYQQSSKLGQALQLAFQSRQLPDVFTTAGLELPFLAQVEGGWVQPLQLTPEQDALIPAENRVEGINTLDGKVYSFPSSGSRLFNANLWHNTELLARAGVAPPTTYDELREACVRMKAADPSVKGIVFNTDATFGLMVDNMAHSAGFEGMNGILFRTGEARWHDDPYVEWLEFMMSLHRDGHVLEGRFNSDDARARFMVGQSLFLLDGIWTVASVKEKAESFLPRLGVSGPITPEAGMPIINYRNQALSHYWLSGQSEHPAEASNLLARFATPEYSTFLARRMYQTPADPKQLDDPEVLPVFRDQVTKAITTAYIAPQLARKNPDLAQVMSKQKAVKPGLTEIYEGLISGQLSDVRGELAKLSAATDAAREAALKAGGITMDDIVFPNWKPQQDYTQEMYQS